MIFKDANAYIAAWLAQPAPALHGKSPLQALRSSKGRQDVLNLIGGIAHGNVL